MSKKRKPWWAKLLISLFSIVLIVVLILGGGCVFLKVKYDISVISTISQIRILNKNVVVSEKYTNSFTDDDKASTRTAVNDCFTPFELITEDYEINTTMPTALYEDIQLTEKQCGALIKILIANSLQFLY